jgi:hypothetical protein
MANKKQAIGIFLLLIDKGFHSDFIDLETSLQILRHIDWFDGIHELPIDVNKS